MTSPNLPGQLTY